MKKEAEVHVEEDKKKEELIDTRNQADALIYSIEQTLISQKDGVSAKEKENIENEIKELREAIKGEDIMNIRNKMEILQKTSHSIAEKLYKKAGAQAEGTGAGGPGAEGEPAAGKEKEETKKEEEEEVEADYEVIDEEEEGKEDEKS